MWLTGFDVKSLSTLYLDKPMKGHTLMQAIARANRVFPGKTCGIVIDYVNVFKFMREALSDYAQGKKRDDFPVKDMQKLIDAIGDCIGEIDAFPTGHPALLYTLGVPLVVDWYKDEQPREKVRAVIQETLNADLPESYDKPVFDAKTNLLLSHFVDMAVQCYGWISAA